LLFHEYINLALEHQELHYYADLKEKLMQYHLACIETDKVTSIFSTKNNSATCNPAELTFDSGETNGYNYIGYRDKHNNPSGKGVTFIKGKKIILQFGDYQHRKEFQPELM